MYLNIMETKKHVEKVNILLWKVFKKMGKSRERQEQRKRMIVEKGVDNVNNSL